MKKLTKPQQEILNRFQKGDRIVVVAVGSQSFEYRWKNYGDICKYRAFWNLITNLYSFQHELKGEEKLLYFVNEEEETEFFEKYSFYKPWKK